VIRDWIGTALLVLGLAPSAGAQSIVPGGWAPEFGFQSFLAADFSGTIGSFSFEANSQPGLASRGGRGAEFPVSRSALPVLEQPQIAHGLDPFADVVRRSLRRRHVR
jgi:hypothetical protein